MRKDCAIKPRDQTPAHQPEGQRRRRRLREQDLLDAIATALDRDRIRRNEALNLEALREAYERLTQREREVMAAVVAGRLNKQMAGALGLSEVTVKMHRGRAMRKMSAMLRATSSAPGSP